MKRKHFVMTAFATMPGFAFAKISAKSGRNQEPFIVRSGNNRSGKPMMKYMGAHPNDVVISKTDTDNALSVFLFTGNGNIGTPLHVHFYQDEFFTVIEGKYRFVCGKTTGELNTGDTIFLPRNIPHQWLQISENGKLLYAVNPAGELEDFFKEVNELKTPTEDVINKLALMHGIEHLGPPLKL